MSDLHTSLTGEQAAKLIGTSGRTAQRCAQQAAAQGDPELVRIGYSWVASEIWWRKNLKRRGRGRPRKDQLDSALEYIRGQIQDQDQDQAS